MLLTVANWRSLDKAKRCNPGGYPPASKPNAINAQAKALECGPAKSQISGELVRARRTAKLLVKKELGKLRFWARPPRSIPKGGLWRWLPPGYKSRVYIYLHRGPHPAYPGYPGPPLFPGDSSHSVGDQVYHTQLFRPLTPVGVDRPLTLSGRIVRHVRETIVDRLSRPPVSR